VAGMLVADGIPASKGLGDWLRPNLSLRSFFHECDKDTHCY
jgi:hypothetical protein